MQALRFFAVFSFLAGIGLLVAGFLRSGDSAESSAPPPVEFAATATPTPGPSNTNTPAPTETAVATATATPAPFDGAVARLQIPRFGVDSAIEPIGLTNNNTQLDVPSDPLNTGWYDIYAKPGFFGNAVFAAHVDYFPDIRGPFYDLSRVNPADQILVVMEDGTTYTYEVISYQRSDASTIPMGEIIWPVEKPEGEEWITLITCGGRFQSLTPGGPGDYLDRDVVVARRVLP
jgi:sortase (surface protein transpeptidase)